ncbi:hypothetical protein BZH17_26885 [Salmonella enterica]|nr:hypothetical protein [Salmonella enterica]
MTWSIRTKKIINGHKVVDGEIINYDTAIRTYMFDCKNVSIMILDETYFKKGRYVYGENHRLGNEGIRKMFGYYPFSQIAPPAANFLAMKYYCN